VRGSGQQSVIYVPVQQFHVINNPRLYVSWFNYYNSLLLLTNQTQIKLHVFIQQLHKNIPTMYDQHCMLRDKQIKQVVNVH